VNPLYERGPLFDWAHDRVSGCPLADGVVFLVFFLKDECEVDAIGRVEVVLCVGKRGALSEKTDVPER